MPLAGLHADAQQLSRSVIGAACNQSTSNSGFYNFLTNTLVANANTNAQLQTDVTNATAHADESYAKPRVNLALTLGLYSGELTDARINPLTTTAGLIGLTYANVGAPGGQPPE